MLNTAKLGTFLTVDWCAVQMRVSVRDVKGFFSVVGLERIELANRHVSV